MPSVVRQKLVIVMLACLTLMVVACAVSLPKSGLKRQAGSSRVQSKKAQSVGQTNILRMLKARDSSPDWRREQFQEWVKNEKPQVFASRDAAIAGMHESLKQAFKYPDMSSLGAKSPAAAAEISNLVGIYVVKTVDEDESDNGLRAVKMYFDNGSRNARADNLDRYEAIQIDIIPQPQRPDPDAWVRKIRSGMEDGQVHADKEPLVIDVNGNAGKGAEPGTIPVRGDHYLRNGFVSWWENGFVYEIYGTPGATGTSLNRLLEIARSMKK